MALLKRWNLWPTYISKIGRSYVIFFHKSVWRIGIW